MMKDISGERMSCVYGPQALQSVGNLGLQLGHGKEQWMSPLHPIILRSVASVKDFLDKLIDVDHNIGKADDTERSTELLINQQETSCQRDLI